MRRFWARVWPHTRGALLLLVFLLGGIDGCPIPPKGKERKWQKPYLEAVRPVQQKLLSPFKFVTKWGRFHQRWALFQAVGRKQWRMEVAGRTPEGTWQIIYRAGDPRYQEQWEMLEFRKLRAIWNPTDAMSGYSKFTSWLLVKVLEEHPEFQGARIRMEEVRLDRGTVWDTGEFKHMQTRERMAPPRTPPAFRPPQRPATRALPSGTGPAGGSASGHGDRADPVKSTKGAPAGVTP